MNFFEWFAARDERWRARPWLVLGKGPTFDLYDPASHSEYLTFGLNHVVSQASVDLAHAIDIDVIDACSRSLLTGSGCLVMPWVPHVRNRPGGKTLLDWMPRIPVLGELAARGRLLWYNKLGSPPHGKSPPVRVVYFSAEAPYALLGRAGVKKIRSLGVDGGNCYSRTFQSLPTLLANGRGSFNRQFDEIAFSIRTYKLDASPLNLECPVKIYVATTEEQMLSVKVLEYSILKHASMSVQVVPLHSVGIPIPRPLDQANLPRTPFSFQRFLIPQLAGDTGRAIYLDSDMQVFADIRQLWEMDMEGHALLYAGPVKGDTRPPQYSVMLLDCGRLRWRVQDIVQGLDSGAFSYQALMGRMVIASSQSPLIAGEWNSLDRYLPGHTKLVHYTDMRTQPWVYALHPLGELWTSCLIEAIDSGHIGLDELAHHVGKGWVRPSLEYQVKNRIADAAMLPRRILDLDRGYLAPYRSLALEYGRLPNWRVALSRVRHFLGGAQMRLRNIKRFILKSYDVNRP